MYKLLIDSGNTRLKVALVDPTDHFKDIFVIENPDQLDRILPWDEIRICIYSDVGGNSKEIEALLNSNSVKSIRCNYLLKFPFQIDYSTPETLGDDRLALVVAAKKEFPHENILIIDAGTCITYDFLDKHSFYRGGAISPGLKMRFRSLNEMTSTLPFVEPDSSRDVKYPGKSTKDSIAVGVIEGIIGEMQRFIDALDNNQSSLHVLISGGDRKFFESQLKGNIFARENLVLEGLNSILALNDSQ